MLRGLKISQQGLIVVLLLLTTQLLFVCILANELNATHERLLEAQHARSIVAGLNRATYLAERSGASLIEETLLSQMEGAPVDVNLDMFDKLMDAQHSKVMQLLKDDQKAAEELDNVRQEYRSVIKSSLNSRDPRGIPMDRTDDVIKAHRAASIHYRQLVKKYSKTDDDGSLTASQSLDRLKKLLFAGVLISVLGTALLAWFFIRRVTRRIQILTDNVMRFATRQSLHKPLKDRDEIGLIDKSFHRMSEEMIANTTQERSLVENSSDIICSLDRDGNFLTVSPAAREEWGYEPEQLVGKNVSLLIGAADAKAIVGRMKLMKSVNERFSFETKLTLANGSRRYTYWSTHWSSADSSLFCFVRDIHSRRLADELLKFQEAQVRNAIEHMAVGIVMVDRTGTITAVNGWIERLFDCDRSVLVGVNVDTLFQPLTASSQSLSALLQSSEEASTNRYNARHNNKSFFADISVPLPSVQKNEDLLLIVEDVSERVELEQVKHEYVTLLGENLRQPLTGVQHTMNSLIEGNLVDDKKKTRLHRITNSIDRLLRLIGELLNIETLAPGQLVGELNKCTVKDVVDQAVDAVKDFAEQQKTPISCQTSEAVIMADQDRLVQVLINLMSNAIKYSPASAPITVAIEESKEWIEVLVIDRGRGVPEEMQTAIFEPYVQTRAADGRRGAGTGLGLAICKTIVEAHSGTIGVRKNQGQGSAFWIKLPRTEDKSVP